jgi:tetratricopeptide (TPR) repeat protein
MRSCHTILTALALTISALSANGAKPRPSQTTATAKSSAHAVELFQEGQQLLQAGSLEQAREKVEQGLKLRPQSARGLNLLGLIYEQEKKYELSAESFQNALKIVPRSAEVHNNLGNVYLLEHKFDAAEKEFRASLSLDASNHDANYNLGVALLAQHRPKEAIPYFQSVQPPSTSSMLNLVQAYLLEGETKEGLSTANRLSAQNKGDVRLHFTLGVMLAGSKQYEAGARELAIADALSPGTYEILYNLGQAYLRSGNLGKAEEVLGRALKLHPDSPQTLYFLAQAYSNQRQDGRALDLLSRAHKAAPRNTDVIFLMARLSMRQSFFEDAIPLLQEGVKIDPRRPDLHAALGECYFTTGKIPQSLSEFQTLIKLDPSARSYAFMALYYRHLGRFDEAKKYLLLGLKADPLNSSCLYNMGYILSHQGNYAEAEKWLQKAIEVDPNNGDALFELASVKMNEKKFAEAIPLLRKCTTLNPHPAPVYYKLATAERGLHQMDAAQRDLKVFETLSKDQASGPYPFQHLFDYLDRRAGLPSQERSQLDLAQLVEEVKLHPDQPRNLYLLAQAYLRLGKIDEAREAVSRLDQLSQSDFRTAVGVGVLLARYHLYPEAVSHFQTALKGNPDSDAAWYDLADAYLGMRDYQNALSALQHVSPQGRQDAGYRGLLGDVDAHLGHTDQAINIFRQLTFENPDNFQSYLSLALAYLRSGNTDGAGQTLQQGLSRIPDSGELFWGMGVLKAVEGQIGQAETYLKKSVDLRPEWPAGYSTLGVLYFETGQFDKVRQTLKEFMENGPPGALNVSRIKEALAAAPSGNAPDGPPVLPPQARQQFLQIALAYADR